MRKVDKSLRLESDHQSSSLIIKRRSVHLQLFMVAAMTIILVILSTITSQVRKFYAEVVTVTS